MHPSKNLILKKSKLNVKKKNVRGGNKNIQKINALEIGYN